MEKCAFWERNLSKNICFAAGLIEKILLAEPNDTVLQMQATLRSRLRVVLLSRKMIYRFVDRPIHLYLSLCVAVNSNIS